MKTSMLGKPKRKTPLPDPLEPATAAPPERMPAKPQRTERGLERFRKTHGTVKTGYVRMTKEREEGSFDFREGDVLTAEAKGFTRTAGGGSKSTGGKGGGSLTKDMVVAFLTAVDDETWKAIRKQVDVRRDSFEVLYARMR